MALTLPDHLLKSYGMSQPIYGLGSNQYAVSDEVLEWLESRYINYRCILQSKVLTFSDPDDEVLFKLRWL